MRNFFLCLVIFAVIGSTACSWRTAPEDSNQNANAAVAETTQVGDADANAALAQGIQFLDTGETDKAIQALTQAVELDPNLAEGWFRLGIAYGLAEKRDEGLEKVDTNESNSAKKDNKPNSEKAFEKAVTAYNKIIKANPDDHVAHFNLGRAYNKLNEDEDAAKALKRAVKLQPEDTEYQTELGAILIKLAQYQEAIPPLKKALELDAENIRAIELLEDAEAGRSRVNYASTPKEDKKRPGDSSTANSNGASTAANSSSTPPPAPRPTPPRPRPSP